ncbi:MULTISPECIES: DUF1636 family protein [unclassified Ruegeria]|uniref:DUF1636 family protein n=1 Tax=unclassified Ruegeria TaxID=2625375 RepID=UPI001488493F|nr:MULTISPECIES: DUF1636 family protein [unclassified Ruegeria]
MPSAPDHFLLICKTCQGEAHAQGLSDALFDRLPNGFSIRMVDCMAGCARPVTVGLQAVDKAQYLFGDIQDTQDIQALTEFAHQYQNSADGWANATERPEKLFTKTLSRMPQIQKGVCP